MSDLISIADVKKEYAEKASKKDLQIFVQKQQDLIVQLGNQVNILKDKNAHLEKMLLSLTPDNQVNPVPVEEMVCIEQIEIIRSKSSERELSLDEIKKLDLLVKNLKLIREKSSKVIDTPNMNNIEEDDLVRIAQSTES